MALTKINFYIGFLLAYSMIIISSMIFLTEQIEHPEISYVSGTDDFVSNYIGYVRNANITGLSDADSEKLKKERLIVEDNTTGGYSVTDTLANINYYSGRVGKTVTYFKLVYNSPSFVVYALGLPYENVRHIINIFAVILFIGLIVMIIRTARGS